MRDNELYYAFPENVASDSRSFFFSEINRHQFLLNHNLSAI